VFLKTETVAAPAFATAISCKPSPLRSAMAKSKGLVPVAKLRNAAKLMDPLVEVFLKTYTVFAP
jgi:hypothetical protein